MPMNKAQVVEHFCAALRGHGWDVTTEVQFVDVVAHKEGLTIYAEAKGHTSSPGLDVDTMYGQLLRRMTTEDDPYVRYAVVVPATVLTAAKRVRGWVRARLRIDVYAVSEDGRVDLHGSTPLTDPDNFRPRARREGRGPPMNVVAYRRMRTAEQVQAGLGLDAPTDLEDQSQPPRSRMRVKAPSPHRATTQISSRTSAVSNRRSPRVRGSGPAGSASGSGRVSHSAACAWVQKSA